MTLINDIYSVLSTLGPPGQQVEIGLGLKLVRIYHFGFFRHVG